MITYSFRGGGEEGKNLDQRNSIKAADDYSTFKKFNQKDVFPHFSFILFK